MKLNEEINQINQKNLASLSNDELKSFSTQLMNVANKTEKNAHTWKLIYNIVGGIVSLIAGVLLLYVVFDVRNINFSTIYLCCGLSMVLLIATYVLKFFYKKANADNEKMKKIYNLKLLEINNQITTNNANGVATKNVDNQKVEQVANEKVEVVANENNQANN